MSQGNNTLILEKLEPNSIWVQTLAKVVAIMIPKDLAKKLEFLLLGNAPNPIHGEILNIDNKDSNISEITAQELTFKGTSLTKRNKNDGIEVTSEE